MKKWHLVGDGEILHISDEPKNKTKPHICYGVRRASAKLIVNAHNAEVEEIQISFAKLQGICELAGKLI